MICKWSCDTRIWKKYTLPTPLATYARVTCPRIFRISCACISLLSYFAGVRFYWCLPLAGCGAYQLHTPYWRMTGNAQMACGRSHALFRSDDGDVYYVGRHDGPVYALPVDLVSIRYGGGGGGGGKGGGENVS